MSNDRVVLQFDGISKGFGRVQALRDVSFDVRAGEVLAMLGENGAGKSTLLKILSGEYQPDEGRLLLDGRAIQFASPRFSKAAGVRVAYQETEIVPGVDVAENLFLGELPTSGGLVRRRELRQTAQATLERLGFDSLLSADALGEQLSQAQKQLVEIARALKPGARVLCLDEPTSSLTDDEAEQLFRLIEEVTAQGVAVIYVSHRMKEILQLADRVVVLRDGQLVDVVDAAETTDEDLVRMMVGRDLGQLFSRTRPEPGPVVLELNELQSAWHPGLSLEVRAGEVVGVSGLIGAGRTELVKVIFGAYPMTGGEISLNAAPYKPSTPTRAIKAGIALAPEDRKGEALVLLRSVKENVSLAILRRLSRARFLRPAREKQTVDRYVKRLQVRTPSVDQEVGKLSGGNQQKVVLARWLASRPSLLILDEPTRGIDIGAKAEIYRLIDELANEGVAILLISSELPEVLGLADRIIVMQGGRITGELSHADATEERILALAMVDELGADSDSRNDTQNQGVST